MTGHAADVEALFGLIEKDVEELKKQQPGHPLLKFADGVLETKPWTKEVLEEFLAQFDKTGKDTVVQVRVGYWKALMEALGKEPKSKEPDPRPAPPLQSADADERIPF